VDAPASGGLYIPTTTALCMAAHTRDAAAVAWLLSDAVGANPNACMSAGGGTALRAAAANGDIGMMRLLLAAGAVVNRPTHEDGLWEDPPLSAAAYRGYWECVRLLLDHGARPWEPNAWRLRETPLHSMAVAGDDAAVVSAALDAMRRHPDSPRLCDVVDARGCTPAQAALRTWMREAIAAAAGTAGSGSGDSPRYVQCARRPAIIGVSRETVVVWRAEWEQRWRVWGLVAGEEAWGRRRVAVVGVAAAAWSRREES
jgi:hypothetical protein